MSRSTRKVRQPSRTVLQLRGQHLLQLHQRPQSGLSEVLHTVADLAQTRLVYSGFDVGAPPWSGSWKGKPSAAAAGS